jgi:hypothetical protein
VEFLQLSHAGLKAARVTGEQKARQLPGVKKNVSQQVHHQK